MTRTTTPFFLVGCPRSGTTLIRDQLKQLPGLSCPEETHFFRWSYPFDAPEFTDVIVNNTTLQSHRALDGVTEEQFQHCLAEATTRCELQTLYNAAFVEGRESRGQRWFDKTPQNVYGLLLLSGMYPEAKFIHIHRHPFNVVASLKLGKVMPVHTTLAAINAWLEPVTIVREYKSAWPDRLLEVAYEDLTVDLDATLRRVLKFIGEDWEDDLICATAVHPEQNHYRTVLSEKDMALINRMLAKQLKHYGYG